MDTTEKMSDSELLALQKQEIDALLSIYLDELTLMKDTSPYKLSLIVRAFLDHVLVDMEELDAFAVRIIIILPRRYPFEAPSIDIVPVLEKRLHQNHLLQMKTIAREISERRAGQPLIFDLAESIRTWVQDHVLDEQTKSKCRRRLRAENMDFADILEDHEEAIVNLRQKTTYTTVTRETFLEWKKKFDAERDAKKNLAALKEFLAKPTGRSLFQAGAIIEHRNEEAEAEELDDYTRRGGEEVKDETAQIFYDRDVFEGEEDVDLDDL